MQKIILFKNGIETLGFFSLEMAKTFMKDGYSVFVFDLLEEEAQFVKLLQFYEPGNTIVISFNFTGFRGEEIFLDEKGRLFWDVNHIPCINIVVDHPFYYHELLSKRPLLYRQFCVDRTHTAYMKKYFKEIPTGFLPLAGTALTPFKPLEDRNIDILFTGNYTPPETFEKYITRLGDDYAVFYRSIIDCFLHNPALTMDEVFERCLKEELGAVSLEDLKECMGNMIFIDLYVRFYFRGKIIQTLVDSGLKVHVFGSGFSLLPLKHPENLIDGGPVDSLTCLEKMQDAKISLNIMPWFKDGSHDRIFNAMLNGSMCITDGSLFLNQEFKDTVHLKYYSLSDLAALPCLIEETLKNPASMKSIINVGYEKSKMYHTWEQRAKTLEPILAAWIK